MKRDQDDYRAIGRMLFMSLGAVVLLYFAMLRIEWLAGALNTVITALQPLLGGIALAYILHPVQLRLEQLLHGKGKKKLMVKLAKPVSTLVTVIAALGLITMFVLVVLPQVIDSIKSLISILPGQVQRLTTQISEYLQTNAEIETRFRALVKSAQDMIDNWLANDLLGSMMALIGNVITVASGLFTLFITVIVSVYLLLGWDKHIAQIKKLFIAVSRHDAFNQAAFDTMAQVNRIFSGFITGKLIDSLIIGVLCFIVMTILRMPYTMLISFIIGVTNIIPMFGPFIGAVPSAFLILLVSPSQCLAFIIFILVLQQVDGNVIGPHILGDSTGLSALYVTIAMLLFSKVFGFIGMILGVPVFGTVYYLVKRWAEKELNRRNLPTDTKDYLPKQRGD